MRVSDFTRRALTFRRDRRDAQKAGYSGFTDWRMQRGGLLKARFVDVKISPDGQTIWFKIDGGDSLNPAAALEWRGIIEA